MSQQEVKTIITEVLSEFPQIHGTIIVARGKRILYHEGFSYSNVPLQTNKHAQYPIASVTKQFTAAALLKALYDEKINQGIAENDTEKLRNLIVESLQTPLSNLLKKEHPIWKGLRPEWAHQVTLNHLLTHTSGIKKYYEPLEFRPSEKYEYSNEGYVLLGSIIQEMAEDHLGGYFKRVLFDPAQMDDTHLPSGGAPADLKEDPKFQQLLLGFEYNPVSEQSIFNSSRENIHFDDLSTAGGIISTAYDLVKWCHALYQRQIIPQFLVDMMITKHVSKEAYSFYDGVDTLWYGYGIDIHEKEEMFYQHCGGISGYQSRLSYNPKTNITIVNLSNVSEEKPPIFTFVNRLRTLL